MPSPKGPIIIEVTDTENGLEKQLVDAPIPPSVQPPTPPFP